MFRLEVLGRDVERFRIYTRGDIAANGKRATNGERCFAGGRIERQVNRLIAVSVSVQLKSRDKNVVHRITVEVDTSVDRHLDARTPGTRDNEVCRRRGARAGP